MKIRLQFLLIASISLIGMTCTDKDEPAATYDSERILQCHNRQTWGLDATKDQIVGLWEWKHAEYIYAVPPDDAAKLNGMKIEFRNDLTGTLTYKGVTPLEFTWSIGTYNIYFGFSTAPEIPQLNGQILFCGNIMLCRGAGGETADGVNNYFQKMQ